MANRNQTEHEDLAPEKKSSQQLLLLVLVLLGVLYGYLYFFTGLIRPRPENPPAQQAQSVVKKPLPPRPNQEGTAGEGGEKSATPDEMAGTKGGQEKTAAVPQEKAKPAGSAGEKPAPAARDEKGKGAAPEKVGKTSVAKEGHAARPGEKEVKGGKAPVAVPDKGAKAKEAAKSVVAKEEKAAKAAPADAKSPKAKVASVKEAAAPGAAKSAAATKPAGEEKPAEAKKQAAPKGAAAKGPAKTGAFALELTSDLAESEMGAVTAKLRKAGITKVEKTRVKKGETMHRLFLADFANHDEAAEELQRLKQSAPDAFMLNENGRYAVYAGSYLREKKAALEQDRLYDKGVKLLMRKANAPVSVVKLRAGSFASKGSADAALQQLKKAGIDAKVIKTGK